MAGERGRGAPGAALGDPASRGGITGCEAGDARGRRRAVTDPRPGGMMASRRPLLAIDSSTSTATIAVGDGSRVLVEIAVDTPLPGSGRFPTRAGHSSTLLPTIDHALELAGLAPKQLGGVVVGAGPGSFTGIRIAAATAKGIVGALALPFFAYSSLLALATHAWASERFICPLLDARGPDVYAATYRFDPGVVVVRSPVAADIGVVTQEVAALPDAVCIGDGAMKHRAELEAAGATVAPALYRWPRAASLLWLADAAAEMGRVRDPPSWEPQYLRASGAERIAAARSRGGDR
ncbi:MAG: tRNA (adenosine(37)-N6)-threonylcarbamoyltransferase complex dimerization subunit type 1 TsaB [Gemmatimonas sp.]|nr:tRNA (adenosine(37)-N6)-threonylcarbamoyltransferase complex dimerization subunit type 1 TsaB [Gemmatimonas sp.]